MTSSVHSSSGVEEEVAIEDGNQEIIALGQIVTIRVLHPKDWDIQ